MALTDAIVYPHVGFHFLVTFISNPLSGPDALVSAAKTLAFDSRWTEVSGLSRELTTEEVIEGGENRFSHKLPVRAKYGSLTLKRGFFPSLPSEVINWANDAIYNLEIKPWQVQVALLNDIHVPTAIWVFNNAYPVKLTISDLKANDNAFLIESIELAYSFFTRESLSPISI